MLAEFIITPDVFSASDEVLRGRLNELQDVLLPRRSSPRFVICKLGSDKWQTAVARKIAAIPNQELRINAQMLFERLVTEVSVDRPLPQADDPTSEREWISSGERSSRQIALDGIVASESISEAEIVLSVARFVSDQYCVRFPNPRFVERTEESQVAPLRTICLHSDWMILRLPQLRGSVDDEIVTLKQVMNLASVRSPGQTKCSVEIHLCKQRRIPDDRLKKVLEDELSCFRGSMAEVNLKFAPKNFTDRQIIAGEWARMPNDQRARRARWLITMTHVAIGRRRESSSEQCTWSLFDRKTAHEKLMEIEESLT